MSLRQLMRSVNFRIYMLAHTPLPLMKRGKEWTSSHAYKFGTNVLGQSLLLCLIRQVNPRIFSFYTRKQSVRADVNFLSEKKKFFSAIEVESTRNHGSNNGSDKNRFHHQCDITAPKLWANIAEMNNK